MTKPAIFLDIDGCLLSVNGNVSLNYYNALYSISEYISKGYVGHGPPVHLCSGRDKNSVEIMAHVLGIVNTWAIAEGGALLFNPTTQQVIVNPAMTEKHKKIFRWIKRKIVPKVLGVFTDINMYNGYAYFLSFERPAGSNINIESVRAMLEGEKLPEKKRGKGLLSKLIMKKILKVETYFDRCVYIFPTGVTKGSAVKHLAEISGIDLSYSIAVGDSRSDFSLFRAVARIGCPSNATEECKQFVKNRRGRVSHFYSAEGVKDVIDWYLSIG